MTVTTEASAVTTTTSATPQHPAWCGNHPVRGVVDSAHELDLAQVWGPSGQDVAEEKLGLTLSCIDGEGPRITVQYLPDGEIPEGFVDLPLAQAKSFWHTMGWLIAQAESGA